MMLHFLLHLQPKGKINRIYDELIGDFRRANNHVIKKLVDMVGTSLKLYNLLMHFLRTMFVKTNDPTYCTLRTEILMGLHDAGISQVQKIRKPKVYK